MFHNAHAERVRTMMMAFRQSVPTVPDVPSPAVRLRQGRLVLAECLELLEALGLRLSVADRRVGLLKLDTSISLVVDENVEPSLREIVAEAADCSVVATGTLLSTGVPPEPVLEIVDVRNLARASDGTWDEYGVFVKGKNTFDSGRTIRSLLSTLGYEESDG